MKRFIIGFIITILFLAYAIGQCNNTKEESNHETDPFYTSDAEQEEKKEEIVESVQEETTEKKDDGVGESNMNVMAQLPANVPSQLISRTAYSLSYNYETLCPNWVAWHLTSNHADGEIDCFRGYHEDEDVPQPRATKEDYQDTPWTHGHMCPAADNKWDSIAMRESNLLTNICPQHASLNSGLWNQIERDCRKWANKYGDVYIVCGPVLLNKEHETIGPNHVVVPEAFFKVILCLQGKPKAIGYVVRNNEGTKKRDQYINTVDEVERITGYDFFPALPDSIEDVVEAYANINDW